MAEASRWKQRSISSYALAASFILLTIALTRPEISPWRNAKVYACEGSTTLKTSESGICKTERRIVPQYALKL